MPRARRKGWYNTAASWYCNMCTCVGWIRFPKCRVPIFQMSAELSTNHKIEVGATDTHRVYNFSENENKCTYFSEKRNSVQQQHNKILQIDKIVAMLQIYHKNVTSSQKIATPAPFLQISDAQPINVPDFRSHCFFFSSDFRIRQSFVLLDHRERCRCLLLNWTCMTSKAGITYAQTCRHCGHRHENLLGSSFEESVVHSCSIVLRLANQHTMTAASNRPKTVEIPCKMAI